MSILAIDMLTSRTRLACHGEFMEYAETRDQAEMLPHQIENVITQAGKLYEDLTAMVCLTGPGSFTGLRVALSSAHALGFSLNIPVIGIATDDAFAKTMDKSNDLALILDTRRKEYAVAFKKAGEDAFSEFEEMSDEAIKTVIKDHVICGNGAQKAGFETSYNDVDLLKLINAVTVPKNGYNSSTAHPLYLRPPDVTLSPQKFEHQGLYKSKEDAK